MALADLKRNNNARKRFYRDARLGTRPAPAQTAPEDAFLVVGGVAATIDSLSAQAETNDFLGVVKRSWQARND